jgi:hypothetical protein
LLVVSLFLLNESWNYVWLDMEYWSSRYEDNFDALSHLLVIKAPAGGKSSIDAFGSKEDFLNSVSYLLGKQAYSGKTASEGGFDNDKVSAANILQAGEEKVNGKTYYKYELLTRTGEIFAALSSASAVPCGGVAGWNLLEMWKWCRTGETR